MTREDMLKKLGSVKYRLIDPPSEWEDIGFTEREIWVNSKGYGYIACDESTAYWVGSAIELSKFEEIKSKLSNSSLTYGDIIGTTIEDFIRYAYCDEDYNDDFLNDTLSEFARLEYVDFDKIYALEDAFDGWSFFFSEKEFNASWERDWCDESWDELDDEMLEVWIERLFN